MRIGKRSLCSPACAVVGLTTLALLPSRENVARAAEKTTETMDIIDTAVGPGMKEVTTVVAAIKAAGLVDTLKGKGPFTVFAPTNAAFNKLPAGTVEELLKPENKEKLTKILTYHVHAGDAIGARTSRR